MKKQIGHSGKITLVSPSGSESVEVVVPGRSLNYRGNLEINGRRYGGRDANVAERQDRRFRRLLSQGWKVSIVKETTVPVNGDNQVREEEKKNTDLVIGTTKTGNLSHGGDHASGEVKDSPNAAKKGVNSRGCRGGQKNRKGKKPSHSGVKKQERIKVQKCSQVGGGAVYAPQPLKVDSGTLVSAKKSASLLARLVGRSPLKVVSGVSVNIEKLLLALEVNDNPLPQLEAKAERPKLKVLVSPDCSGSCQSWNGLGQAWAIALSKIPDVDVVYSTNFNGELWQTCEDAETLKLIKSMDVVLYLGDGDGKRMCDEYAALGATVVALDCYAARAAKPRLKKERIGKGVVLWVDRVSAKDPKTWEEALSLCLKS